MNFDELKNKKMMKEKINIAIIGLGYVGLPLAVLLAKKFNVLGFDTDNKRIQQLNSSFDKTNEVSEKELKESSLRFSNSPNGLSDCGVIIVTVPTPVDSNKNPDLTPIKSATETLAKYLKKGATIVYESTVFPGVTEEICVPIIEKITGLKWKEEFFVGYSPERVNPGDKSHTIDKIAKVVSGDTPRTKDLLKFLYGSIIIAEIHIAPTIKTAEAAKVIENTQRDLNIALMNELSIIFEKMHINTNDVLMAAKTKWNFLPFFPGLVGGHCIGVDPYYLTYKAKSLGYHPQVILSGRDINDKMGAYIGQETIKKIIKAGKIIKNGKVLICGFTFKEDVSDLRNTKVIDIYNELKEYGITPVVYDPHADKKELSRLFDINQVNSFESETYLAVIVAVKHKSFKEQLPLAKLMKVQEGIRVLIDIKGMFNVAHFSSDELLYFSL